MKNTLLNTLQAISYRSKTERFSIIYIVCCLIIGISLLIENKVILGVILLLVTMFCFFHTIMDIAKNKYVMEFHSRSMYTISTLFFSFVFSEYAISKYLEIFNMFPHNIKEILVLIFINMKIIMFVFALLVNFIILIENFIGIFEKKEKFLEDNFKSIKSHSIIPVFYELKLYEKEKKGYKFIFHIINYIITTPINLILTTIRFIIKKCTEVICFILLKVIKNFNNIYHNKTIFLVKVLKVVMIISLTITNIIITLESDVFLEQIIDIFNFISSVILIPLIYEQLKSNLTKNMIE